MPRPRTEHPTPAELEVLKVIWQSGPATVRRVMAALNRRRPRAYTSVMNLMSLMARKGLLTRTLQGRSFVYSAAVSSDKTRRQMLGRVLNQVFEGSASLLVSHLLRRAAPSADELQQIRELIKRAAKAHEKGDD